MALVGYGSSDEEDEDVQLVEDQQPKPIEAARPSVPVPEPPKDINSTPTTQSQAPSQQPQQPQATPSETHLETASASSQPPAPGPSVGPQLGPSMGPSTSSDPLQPFFPPLEGAEEDNTTSPSSPLQAPGSPYTSYRTTLRSLTLPTVPNMDIPPSPPGSPSPSQQQLNAKFEQFLTLKKQGIHFNNKITSSSALKNPSLMDKLMGFVDMDHKAQYANTLDGEGMWKPDDFPRWSYKEQLRQSQSDLAASRARSKGAPVAFVPSTALPSTQEHTAESQAKRKSRFDM